MASREMTSVKYTPIFVLIGIVMIKRRLMRMQYRQPNPILERRFLMMNYKPLPIDTNDVILTDDIMELSELIAKNTHEVWSAGRIIDQPKPSCCYVLDSHTRPG